MPAAVLALRPRNPDGTLRVVVIGRISTPQQNIGNIDASYRYVREYLDRIYQGPLEITCLGEQASGMRTDRASIRQAEELVASGTVDLVIAEDLARIYRNPRFQYLFVQDAVDMGTRVICIGDNLDTADENWEITMGTAALRHGLHIPDTRRRVRRTATHAFHTGGMVQKVRFGYRKVTKEEAESGHSGATRLRVARIPELTPVIQQMAERVSSGQNYQTVADWLNSCGIKPGRYVESGRWTARVVVDLLDDPILSGTRTFRDTVCHPVYSTGRHKPCRNDEPETEHYTELAHLSTEVHAALRAEIARRRSSQAVGDFAHRRGVPRSRSIWPGQAALCGVCHGMMYYAGHYLKCKNSLRAAGATCWNHVQVPCRLTRQLFIDWLMANLVAIPDGLEFLRDAGWSMAGHDTDSRRHRRVDLLQEITTLERQGLNLAKAVAEGGAIGPLVKKLRELEITLVETRRQLEEEEIRRQIVVPTKEQFALCLKDNLELLVNTSSEFADFLRNLLRVFVIQPVQALDSGLIRPRAKLAFQLPSQSCSAMEAGEGNGSAIVQGSINLFEPALHIRWVAQCVQLKQEEPRLSLKQMASHLRIGRMTVKRALDYANLMSQRGVTELYLELADRPSKAPRWR